MGVSLSTVHVQPDLPVRADVLPKSVLTTETLMSELPEVVLQGVEDEERQREARQ